MTPQHHAIAADYVFDGDELRRDAAVLIRGTKIEAVLPHGEIPADVPVETLASHLWLAPGFIDVQVNGGGDVLFNDDPSPASIAAIRAAHLQGGTTSLLPTLITDRFDIMRRAREAVDTAMESDPGVLGIHFEGPFLNPGKAGIHDPALMRAPDDADWPLLAGKGVTLVTLAPECVPAGFIARLAARGTSVALGHSLATYEQAKAAIAEGLSGFTHLFNAMPPLSAREPGPVAAALETPSAFYGLIADGEHVAPAMLNLALRGVGQAMLVTDAMPPVHGKKTGFTLQGRRISVEWGRAVLDGRLAGSLLDMASTVNNATGMLAMPLPEALRRASRIPAEFLGLGAMLGRLAPAYRADLIAFDPKGVRIAACWVAGKTAWRTS